MGILRRDRHDGIRVRHGDPLLHVMPYIMCGRNESVVYYKRSVPIEAFQKYIVEQRRKGIRITMFNLIVASLLQTVYRRPMLNRYIIGRRLYEHRNFEATYTVKQSLTDEGLESVAKVGFDPDDTIFTVAEKMGKNTAAIKQGELKGDDKFIRLFTHMPRWFMRLVASLLRFLDFHGLLPGSFVDILPFYSTIFISHLGSLGADAPFHHLYEFGTNSMFLTIGRTYEAPYKAADGGVEWKRTIDLAFSIDERVCDGFYLIRSLKLFEQFLQNPQLLEYPASAEIDVMRPASWPERQREQREKQELQGASGEAPSETVGADSALQQQTAAQAE